MNKYDEAIKAFGDFIKFCEEHKQEHDLTFDKLALVALQQAKDREKVVLELQEDENFIQTKYGYCFYSLGNCPLIYNLYVHPQYRRCGHSKMLLKCVIDEIRKTGYTGEITIQAEPEENSIELSDIIKYYNKTGLIIKNDHEPKGE